MTDLRAILIKTVREHYPKYDGAITLDVKKDRDDFEYSSPVAFGLAKAAGTSPQEIANTLVPALQEELGDKVRVHVADGAPPFINFSVGESYWREALTQKKPEIPQFLDNKRALIEFISANPTGPLTLANARGGYSGDALARALTLAGADVEREYYVNDTGNQIRQLGKSILAKQSGTEIEDGYKGEYIDDLATHIHGESEEEVGEKAASYILEHWIQPSVATMGITYDQFFSEKQLVDQGVVQQTFDLLDRHNVTYASDGATWLRTTDFGDDKDRVIKRSDGTFTYFMTDIAYHWDKLQRGYDTVVTMVGADHFVEARALEAVIQRILAPTARWQGEFVQPIYQFVRLIEEGKEVKMSKRSGSFVTLDDLLAEIPSDVARFFFVSHSLSNAMDFDLTLAKKKSDENPVYYVQYAYVRAKHILEKLDTTLPAVQTIALDSEERRLLLHLLELPQVIEDITLKHEVHGLAHYAVELAKLFHAFYSKHPVLKANAAQRAQRIAITHQALMTLQLVLQTIGVSQPDRMMSE